eukprot:6503087-Prymnesium_polylepis.1
MPLFVGERSEWLEVSFANFVALRSVSIYEMGVNGPFVTKVEAYPFAGSAITVWEEKTTFGQQN